MFYWLASCLIVGSSSCCILRHYCGSGSSAKRGYRKSCSCKNCSRRLDELFHDFAKSGRAHQTSSCSVFGFLAAEGRGSSSCCCSSFSVRLLLRSHEKLAYTVFTGKKGGLTFTRTRAHAHAHAHTNTKRGRAVLFAAPCKSASFSVALSSQSSYCTKLALANQCTSKAYQHFVCSCALVYVLRDRLLASTPYARFKSSHRNHRAPK